MKSIVLLVVFAAAFAQNPAWSQPWRDTLNRARSLYKNGKFEEALKYYKSAERLAPNDVDLSEEKGQSAYRAGDYSEAERSFRTAAGRQTDKKRKVAAYNNLGNSQLRQKNYGGAENAFKDALRIDPSNEKARQLLGEAKRLKKEEEEKQKKQQQQQQNNQQNQENNQNGQQQQQNGNQQQNNQQSQSPNQQDRKNQQQQNQSGQQSGNKDSRDQQGGSSGKEQKLADKQTERKLDELMRQEMDAKKRLDGSKGNSNGKKAKKDW
jgi:Ca-activated chloride channel homolog